MKMQPIADAAGDGNNTTFINLLRRASYRKGYRLTKRRSGGFVISDVRNPEKAVLGGDRVSGASLSEVEKFLGLTT